MKLDTHVHTVHSGRATVFPFNHFMRESYNTPESVYATARKRGMDLVTITDHDQISGAVAGRVLGTRRCARRVRGHGRVARHRPLRPHQRARHHAVATRRDSAAATRRAAIDAVLERAGHLLVAQSRGLRDQWPADRDPSGSGAAVGRRSGGHQRHAPAAAESHRDVPRRGDGQAHAWRRRFAHGPRHWTDVDGSAWRADARGIHAGFARRPGHRRRRARRRAHDDVGHVALRRQFHDRGGDDDGTAARGLARVCLHLWRHPRAADRAAC